MYPSNNNLAEVQWSHVELTAGTITSCTVETMDGVRAVLAAVGKFAFFIDLIDLNGGRLAVRSCGLYDEAIELAEEARGDFDIAPPVHDLILGDH